MKTKWNVQTEFPDGSGLKEYQCQAPQENENQPGLKHLYEIAYIPAQNRITFCDTIKDASRPVEMSCSSWLEAEKLKEMLTRGKSHWMEPAVNPPPKTIGEETAEYKNTPEGAKDLIRRLTTKLMDINCPHCGRSVPVELNT